MKTLSLCLAALVAAVTLTSVAAAGPEAAKQRVRISMKDPDNGTFVLTPLRAGTLKRDSGTVRVVWSEGPDVMRQGQQIFVGRGTYTLKGKRGSLSIRELDRVALTSRTRRPRASTSPRVSASAPGRS